MVALELIRKQKEIYSVVAKKRVVFEEWKCRAKDNRRAFRKLECFVARKSAEKAFYEIRTVSNIKDFVLTRKKTLTRVARILYTSSLKKAFSSWKTTIFLKHHTLSLFITREHEKYDRFHTKCQKSALKDILWKIHYKRTSGAF